MFAHDYNFQQRISASSETEIRKRPPARPPSVPMSPAAGSKVEESPAGSKAEESQSNDGVGNPFTNEDDIAEPENVDPPPEIISQETENSENDKKPEPVSEADQSELNKSGNPFEDDEEDEPGVDNSNKDTESETAAEPVAIEPVVGLGRVIAWLVASNLCSGLSSSMWLFLV